MLKQRMDAGQRVGADTTPRRRQCCRARLPGGLPRRGCGELGTVGSRQVLLERVGAVECNLVAVLTVWADATYYRALEVREDVAVPVIFAGESLSIVLAVAHGALLRPLGAMGQQGHVYSALALVSDPDGEDMGVSFSMIHAGHAPGLEILWQLRE
ncbi:unnamed protein product [Clonostachys rhizophaga]|uniref:Uncharacterized protein n=1 Tax=Clonostachys rhizophaga TaxID=160324 RepID=A0A9N9VQ95_9HYPO|nr:unnamed protein product [Clonostachys rhizophaga]